MQMSVRPAPEDCTKISGSYYLLLNYLHATKNTPHTDAFYSTSTSLFVDEWDEV